MLCEAQTAHMFSCDCIPWTTVYVVPKFISRAQTNAARLSRRTATVFWLKQAEYPYVDKLSGTLFSRFCPLSEKLRPNSVLSEFDGATQYQGFRVLSWNADIIARTPVHTTSLTCCTYQQGILPTACRALSIWEYVCYIFDNSNSKIEVLPPSFEARNCSTGCVVYRCGLGLFLNLVSITEARITLTPSSVLQVSQLKSRAASHSWSFWTNKMERRENRTAVLRPLVAPNYRTIAQQKGQRRFLLLQICPPYPCFVCRISHLPQSLVMHGVLVYRSPD